MPIISYGQAIAQAHVQSMQQDPSVYLMGVGIADPTGIFGTTLEARKKFGTARVIDTPMSENTLTGMGVGSAICGMRPVLIHARNDFLLLTLDQIINHAAKWSYMNGGKFKVPFLIRAIIGRGWGQAAQHSQSLQAMLAHVPGINVIMPVSAYDAKGMILEAMRQDRTTVCIEHRWLHQKQGEVPEEIYYVPFGKARLVQEGSDCTVVAISHMVNEAEIACQELLQKGISVDLLDLRSLRPLDEESILKSLQKTGRLVVVDTGWKACGISAEIAAIAAEKGFSFLKAPVARVALPDVPTPCSPVLEAAYYPTPGQIVQAVEQVLGSVQRSVSTVDQREHKFFGPF